MTVEVHENFLDETEHKKIVSIIENPLFSWKRTPIFNPTYSSGKEYEFLCEEKYNHQFAHFVYVQHQPVSKFADDLLTPFVNKLKIRAPLRCKVNFNPCTEKIIEHCYHYDDDVDVKTAIYYVNTNNGYTKFKDGTKVESVANRLLLMPNNILHTGTSCSDVHGRIVLVINYL